QYIVPVELTSFAAASNGADVELNWTTSTETNNQGFQVERMIAGGSFENVGYVAGFGTTTEPKAYSFVDSKLETGNYTYRLKQIDFDGTFTYSEELNVEVELPLEYALEQNYPNPFNPSTKIKYSIAEDGLVKIAVFNMLGEEVATLVNTQQKAGRYEVNFNASGLSSGVYVYRIEAANYTASKKLMFMK
ncbi:MAG TPA: T9SS type A sorting domain-containing protein, partial [Ignavibacteriaceae bacterium]